MSRTGVTGTSTGAGRRSVLVNFVYCPPVGHAIEALHYCNGYHRGDPSTRIGVALNADTPVELASLCPFVDAVFPVRVDVFDPGSAADAPGFIPDGWGYVVNDDRGSQPAQRTLFPGLAAYYDCSRERFAASGSAIGTAGAAPPAYARGEQLRLDLPVAARAAAEELIALPWRSDPRGPRIAVLPAGSGPRRDYPSVRSWRAVIGALRQRWPEAVFCLLGKHRQDGRTTTSFARAELDELVATARSPVEAVDLPLVEQLALVAACEVLVAPHSGFGMAALAVGTPWLSIGGNRWPEHYFNGVPFYSLLPDVSRFPAYHHLGAEPEPVEDDGSRSPSMCYERIRADLAELVEYAGRLIERRWSFEAAMADHFRRLTAVMGGRSDLIFSTDAVHERYLPPVR